MSVLDQLPKYRCHKFVRAAKITEVVSLGEEGVLLQLSVDERKLDCKSIKHSVNRDWVLKHKPYKGGYLVVYEDNYTSFSPPQAFEAGYRLILKMPKAENEKQSSC